MRRSVMAVILLLCGWGLAQGQPPGAPYLSEGVLFDVYWNQRYGFTLPYPAEWVAPRLEPGGQGGRVFQSADGLVTLWAFGTNTPPAASIGALFDMFSTETPERSVTYGILRDTWFVVSGFEGDRVYYLKVFMPTGCAAMVFFRIEYPRDLKPVYDPVTTEISHNFAPTACTG